MNIFFLILGIVIGFGLKFGADQYFIFIKREKEQLDRMEDILAQWKAIELNKQ